MINYYHRYVPMIANHLAPLHAMINRASATRSKQLVWNKTAVKSFDTLKQKFSDQTLLTHFDRTA